VVARCDRAQAWEAPIAPVGLSALDLACGMPLGQVAGAPPPALRRDRTLEQVVDEMHCRLLAHGPLYVAFTGGRGSTASLALSVNHARRHGHELPIPVTVRYPGIFTDAELRHQERIIAHLRLDRWERVSVAEDLDLVGPLAARVLSRTGAVWPAHAYTLVPLMERAREGLLTIPTGSSDFFGFWRWAPLASVLAGRRRPTARDLMLLLASLLPAGWRTRLALRRGYPPPMPWLRPDAERHARKLLAARQAMVPLRFDQAVLTQSTHRCFAVGAQTVQRLAEMTGARVLEHLYEREWLGGFAAAGGWRGFGTSRELFARLAGHLLPPGALAPPTRADLTPVLFGAYSRGFAESWSGGGLDPELIDAERLRAVWLSERPDARSACLLQYAWLSERSAQGNPPPAPPRQAFAGAAENGAN